MSGKLLILGASSQVGRHLYRRLGSERAIGTYNRKLVEGGRRFDSITMRLAEVVIPGEASHAVIMLADPHPDSCARDLNASRRLNITAMRRLIEDCWSLGIKPLFASTDHVFDGKRGWYAETDEAQPVQVYGRQKKEIEDFLAQSGQPYACFRLSKVYGDRPRDGTLFTDWIGQVLDGVKVIRCASDQVFSPVFGNDVATALLAMVDSDLSGLFHLSGNQRHSRLQLLELTLAAMKRHQAVSVAVEACSIEDFGLPEPRPKDVSLSAAKLVAATGIRLTDIEARIETIVAGVLS